jgi:hypothetical protein
MLRALLLATVATATLGACTQYSVTPYGSASNPPGWVDRNRDGVDDRNQSGQANPANPPGWVDNNRDGVDDRTQAGQYPANPPGWIDSNRDGVDDRTQRPSGGYYDRNGVWRAS